jgi:hypothetical protein
MTRSFALTLFLVGGMIGLVACSPAASIPDEGAAGAAGAFPRPASLANLPLVDLIGPATTGAGPAPVFEWRPVDGARDYRLSVRGPAFRSWAWAGPETSVRYGGVTEGQSGPTIIPGTHWSVAALGADGSLLALSELRPVSPTNDPGPAPDWMGAPTPTAEVAEASPVGAFDACAMLSADEITAAIDGTWGTPELTPYPGGQFGHCQWTSKNRSILSIDVMPASAYDPDGWGADGTVTGLGEKSYVVSHGWDRRIGFTRGDRSVMLVIDWTRVDMKAFSDLARKIEARLS